MIKFLIFGTLFIPVFFACALTILQSKFILSFFQDLNVRYFYNTNISYFKPFTTITGKEIVLTIDDGPDNRTTPLILEVLRKHQVPATFFLIGEKVENNIDLVKKIDEDGHILGNHDYKDFASISRRSFSDTFNRTHILLNDIREKGSTNLYFRPGCGFYNSNMVNIVRKEGYKLILGNIYPHDVMFTRLFGITFIINYILYRVSPGSIIILHDGRPNLETHKVLDILIPKLKDQGYTFKSLDYMEQKYN